MYILNYKEEANSFLLSFLRPNPLYRGLIPILASRVFVYSSASERVVMDLLRRLPLPHPPSSCHGAMVICLRQYSSYSVQYSSYPVQYTLYGTLKNPKLRPAGSFMFPKPLADSLVLRTICERSPHYTRQYVQILAVCRETAGPGQAY